MFIANLDEAYRGYVRWYGGKPVEYNIGRIVDGFQMPYEDELSHRDQSTWETDRNGEPKDPWQKTYRLVMKDSGGELLTFVGSSWGAERGLRLLFGAYDRDCKDPGKLWPVVKLGADHRTHKTYGVVIEPRFNIVSWSTWDGRINAKVIAAKQKEKAEKQESFGTELDDEIPF
jgi:hypothetical protein